MEIDKSSKDYRTGVICVVTCQLIWGLCPIYWQALEPIPSWVIILYRIVTMFIYSYAAARFRYSREEIWGPLKDRSVRRMYFTSGLILTVNWSIYIWAMTSERVIQAAIGYYIEPLVICAVGIVVFKEKLTKYNLTAMAFAAAAILLILVHYGQLPGVALGLAGTWAVYSAIKKTSKIPAIIALVYETMLYAAIAVVLIPVVESRGLGALSLGMPGKYCLMLLCGLVTLVPVALFGFAAPKVTMLLIGMAQYISPTITLLLGIFLFREPIDRTQITAFIIIWIGLVFFTYGEFRNAASAVGASEKTDKESLQ